MTDERPDTDDRHEPGGTPSGSGNLTARPAVPGDDGDQGAPTAVPGVYEADEDDQARGRESQPGN